MEEGDENGSENNSEEEIDLLGEDEDERLLDFFETQNKPSQDEKNFEMFGEGAGDFDYQDLSSGEFLNDEEESLEKEEKESEKEKKDKQVEKREEEEEREDVEEVGEEEEERGEDAYEYPAYEGEEIWHLEDEEVYEEEEEDSRFKDRRESTTSEALSNVYNKLSPFSIKWSFGVNKTVQLINLTTSDAFEIFYVSSHFGVIFNYRKNTMVFLPGHNYPIESISADASGRWLVSADTGEDNVIIVWDKKKRVPVWSLFNVFPGEGTRCASISQDARFLAAVNCNFNFTLKFWVWTRGPVSPNGVIHLDPAYGKAKHICFNQKNTTQLAISLESKTIFCEWSTETEELDCFWSSYEPSKKKLGVFVESLFLDDNHTALTATSNGHVVVWCDVKYSEPISDQTPGTIKKVYLKTVRLHKTGITSLRLSDKIIMSSSEDGSVFFHDQFLRLMYWLPKLKLDPLVSVSFNLSRIPLSSDPFSPDFHDKIYASDEEIENVTEYEISTTGNSETFKEIDKDLDKDLDKKPSRKFSLFTNQEMNFPKQDPSDCTIDMRPIAIRDFMFLTTTGRVGYVSHRRRKVKYYLYNMDSTVLCIDCHPSKSHLVTGDAKGQLTLFEYVQKKIMNSAKLGGPIRSLKYSSMGHVLMAGLQNGYLLELDPFLLLVRFRIEMSSFPILKICFSHQDELIALYDQNCTVYACVSKKKQGMRIWSLMGKYNSHYKPIRGILFEQNQENPLASRLFTLGEDRMLVEYDVRNILENKLNILNIGRVEQTAIPFCFDLLPQPSGSSQFLISNDEYKLKIIDPQSRVCQKTTLGPTADTPINFMKVISMDRGSEHKMIYATQKHIGIRIVPPTGNPFEGMGIVAHPDKLMSIAVSSDHEYVFTAGVDDSPLLVWKINLDSVEVSAQLGGLGLEPFVSLIEGGPNSFLFKEIEDFFYYAQIIHQGEDPNLDRSVSTRLALCEVPDLFRSLGYYPTDYEVENILYELKYLNYHKTHKLTTEVTFEECVKAYLNHKPVRGMSLNLINKALLAIADLTDPSDVTVEREELYKALEKNAESMDHAEVIGYLCILLLPKDEVNPIPSRLSLSKFAENVLGIDLSISEENVRQITHAFETKNSSTNLTTK